MSEINWYYKNRDERSKWITERFKKEFENSITVLDVGCYTKELKKYLSEDTSYTGIDIAGSPDLSINLETIEKLPFKSNFFDIVVCADVLEHLENIHLIFDELCRVSSKYVIITLPNPISGINRYILKKIYATDLEAKKRFGKYLKYYGLPLERPEDRHKWFFSYEDVVDFIRYRSNKFDFDVQIIENNLMYEKFTFPKNLMINVIKMINMNLAYRDVIFLLEKKSS